MKMVFNAARLTVYPPKGWLACLALALCVTAGCGKSGTSAPAAPPVATDATSAQVSSDAAPADPVPRPMPTVAVAATDDSKKQLQALNRALVGWVRQNGHRPKTFEEFASTAGFQIPAPPSGKKYAFSERGFIVLVDNTSN